MCGKCQHIVCVLKHFYTTAPFCSGMLAGVLLLLFIFLLLAVLRFFFRPKKMAMLSYTLPHGAVSVRAAAIADLVRSVSLEFPEFNVHNVVLLKKRKVVYLQVQVIFFQKERSFPDASSAFQQSVLTALKESFGISSVERVDIQLRNNSDQAK